MDYLIAQSLSLVFYFITLIVYNRARKEYVGGKIAAAIKLIMVFMVVLFFADFVDYFIVLLLPVGQDTLLIIKIILKLIAICVLFFGGIKFFVKKSAQTGISPQSALFEDIAAESSQLFAAPVEPRVDSTVVLQKSLRAKPALGRYEIIEQIGRGAMGIVYKGRDPKLQRLTAIKTIRFGDEFDEIQAAEIKAQFYREAEVVAKLSHPNIVTVYDVGEDLDLSYLAMEYLEGESLEQYTKADNLLPIKECVNIVIQVCDALEYAHNHGIVHRDIKPANIMFSESRQVKVADFGIARVAASSKTHTGIIKGTPYYMSPEQAKGLKVTGASDIFSLGVVFYQLLTGKLPFSGENPAAIMYQTTNVDPEPATKYNAMINSATMAVLNRCLKKSVTRRYQTARQLGEDMRLLLQGLEKEPETAFENDIDLENVTPQKEIPDPEEFIELSDADIFYDPVVSETEPSPDNDSGVSETDRAAASYRKTDEFLSAPVPPEMPLDDTKNHNENQDAISAEPEKIEAEKQYAAVSWQSIQNEKNGRPNLLSKHAKRIVFYGCLFLLVSGIGCYFYWQSSHVEVSIIRKRRNLPVDFKNIKTYINQQKKKKPVKAATIEKKPLLKQQPAVANELQVQRELSTQIQKPTQAPKEPPVQIHKPAQVQKESPVQIHKPAQVQKESPVRIHKPTQVQIKRSAQIKAQKLEAAKRSQTNKIDNLIADAKKFVALKKYSDAQNSYLSALKIIENSNFKTELSFIKRKGEIEKALTNEDIVYGVKGYVQYKHKWYSPDEYENQLRRDGFVEYKGRFRKYTELKNTIRRVTYPIVNSFLTSKYSGQNVHKKQINFHRLTLKQNTPLISHFTVSYKWEVWTFSEIGEGQCSVDLYYDIKQDRWEIIKGCK